MVQSPFFESRCKTARGGSLRKLFYGFSANCQGPCNFVPPSGLISPILHRLQCGKGKGASRRILWSPRIDCEMSRLAAIFDLKVLDTIPRTGSHKTCRSPSLISLNRKLFLLSVSWEILSFTVFCVGSPSWKPFSDVHIFWRFSAVSDRTFCFFGEFSLDTVL